MDVSGSLKFGWYGDDFTGATDTLATAAQAGLRSLLFLGLPTPERLARAGPLDGLGIAGAARTMTPIQMQAELAPVGRLFAELAVPVMHYKVCSTFDSSPAVGSIGAAAAILRATVSNSFVPIVGGQPSLGRYCVFGHLFARAGNDGKVYRIDRHPTMSRHPVTPMQESDLRLHLAAQGMSQVASLDYPAYAQEASLDAQLDALLSGGAQAVLLDAADEAHLASIGRLIWQRAQQQRLLAVGPSSVIQALAAHWQNASGNAAVLPMSTPIVSARGPVLVLAGSLSPLTAQQVAAAGSYARVPIDPARLLASDAVYSAQLANKVIDLLKNGHSVLACTTKLIDHDSPTPSSALNPRALATACGHWLAQVLEAAPVQRLGIAGGDTSSHAVQALDAWGLSYLQSFSPGVALCRLHSDQAHLNGMEIILKGGQMGATHLFEHMLHGM